MTDEDRDEARRKRRELFDREPDAWSLGELVSVLTERYAPTEIPPCRVCGGELSIQSIGGGESTKWACSGYEDDPDRPGHIRMSAGRSAADEHYSRSYFIDSRRGGDELVMEAVRRLERASANLEAIRSEP